MSKIYKLVANMPTKTNFNCMKKMLKLSCLASFMALIPITKYLKQTILTKDIASMEVSIRLCTGANTYIL